MTFEFTIRCETLNSGEQKFIPLMRPKTKFSYVGPSWTRIVKIYDRYIDLDISFEPNLTLEECEQHIEGFKEQYARDEMNKVKSVSFIPRRDS